MGKKKIIKRTICLSVIALLSVALIIGNILCTNYFDIITEYFHGSGMSDFFESKEMQNALAVSDELVREIEAEGVVLLRNEERNGKKTLPLENDELKKVNLFGWASSDAGWINGSDGSVNGNSGTNKGKAQKLTKAFLDAGIEYNTELMNMYTEFRAKRSDKRGLYLQASPQTFFMLIEPTENYYNAAGVNGKTILQNAKDFSSTAIVVISRLGGEGCDLPPWQSKTMDGKAVDEAGPFTYDYERTYLDISTEEEKMLQLAKSVSEKVIVIINNCNNMNLSFLEDYDVDAAISVGGTGQSGVHVIPKILSGEINPSGKTAATQPYDLKYDAAFWNSGRMGGENGYQVYQEGIYVGYKWYETADAEGFWDDYQRALPDGSVIRGYNAVVQYPFGYGLSYTDFKWEIVDVSPAAGSLITAETDKITVKVRVTNVGNVPGKDIVQLYYTPPYTKGGIEKSAKNLVAFAKSAELKPASLTEEGIPESQVLELSFTPYEMASYDCYDKNHNRFVGYEIESGEHRFGISTNAHDYADCVGAEWSYNVRGTIKLKTDPVSGNVVTNRFTNYETVAKNENGVFVTIDHKAYANCALDGSDADQTDVTYLTRANFKGTFPQKTAERRSGSKVTAAESYLPEIKTVTTAPKQGENNGLLLVTAENGSKLTASQLHDGSIAYKINEELLLDIGLDYDSPTWDKLLNQMTKDELLKLVRKGNYANQEVESIGKPILYDSDGPAGLNRHTISSGMDRTNWTMFAMPSVMAQSWNTRLSYAFGLAVANEAIASGNKGWYAPGANMQRSFFCGRNSEYYSEDAFLSGKMAAESCRGSINNGMYAYVKHFALNETETNRKQLKTWVSEQALREIYLRPFEIAVKEGNANGIMVSMNYVGGVWSGANRAMTQEVLREEWGFRGSVVTDTYQKSYNNLTQAVIGGVDLMLGDCTQTIDMDNPTYLAEMRESAKNIIYAWANAYAISKNHDASEDIFTVNVDNIVAVEKPYPYWFLGVIALDVLVAVGFIIWIFFLFKKKKSPVTTDGNGAPFDDSADYTAATTSVVAAQGQGEQTDDIFETEKTVETEDNFQADVGKPEEEQAEEQPEAEEVQAEAEEVQAERTFDFAAEKKSLAESYYFLPDDKRQYFDSLRAKALSLKGVKKSEAKEYVTFSVGRERIMRLRIRRDQVEAVFYLTDPSYKKSVAKDVHIKDSATVIKLDSDAKFQAAMDSLEYRYNAVMTSRK